MRKRQAYPQKYKYVIPEPVTAVKNLIAPVGHKPRKWTSQYRVVHHCEQIHTHNVKALDPIYENVCFKIF